MTNTSLRAARLAVRAGFLLTLAAPLALGAQGAAPAQGQLSLSDALQLAERRNEALKIAEAGLSRAQGQRYQARSQLMPQINATGGYQRTIESQFQAISKKSGSSNGSSGSSGGTGGSGSSSGSDLASSPIAKIFAAPNTVTLGLTFAQNLFTAGKVTAANKGADAAERAAIEGVSSARAQMVLDVAQAYYNAVAADRMASIADSTLAQAERSLAQTTLQRQVGSSAEFDLLRARVTRDNARPQAISAHGNRDIAFLRLRQLLGIPLAAPLTLTTPVRDDLTADQAMSMSANTVLSTPAVLPRGNLTVTPDTSVDHRAPVKQAAGAVEAQRYALRAARWERLPSLQITSLYQRFGYPPAGTFLPNSFGLFYPNWTATFGLSFPVLSSGRIKGDRMIAEANFIEAQQRLQQAREGAELDARISINQYEQAQAAYAASVGTDEQAAKAYQIAEVRYREGVSTLLELDQSRTQLAQARINRVTAARDFELARLRLALLRDLPISGVPAMSGPPSGATTQPGGSR